CRCCLFPHATMFYLNRTTCLRAFLVGLLTIGPANAAPAGHEERDRQAPTVWPPPQEISSSGPGVSLKGAVTIVTGKANDTATIDAVKAVVKSAGGQASLSGEATNQGTQIFIGTEEENSAAADVAKKLTGSSAS